MTIYQKNTDRIREHLREFILAKLRDNGRQTVTQLVQSTVVAFTARFVESPLDLAVDVLIVLHDLRDKNEIVGEPIELTDATTSGGHPSGYAYSLPKSIKTRSDIREEVEHMLDSQDVVRDDSYEGKEEE